VAAEILYRVDAHGAWSGVLLQRTLERARLGPADRGLATELTLGTLRRRAEVDWALARYARTPLESLPPRIRAVLRLSAYQLLFLQRVPPHAACNEAVELARRAGHTGTARLVNAVLRRLAASPERAPEGDTVDAIALRHSHPRWLVARWVERLGTAETRALCEANNAAPPATVRLNTLRGAPEAIATRLAERGVHTEPSPWLAEARRMVVGADRVRARRAAYEEGWLSPQDDASMLVSRRTAARPGDVVIDACAAPGGKSAHLAALMENRGRIIACDVHPAKLAAVARQCARLGVTIVETRELDAARLGEAFAGAADRVVVDAPCSGLGVLRRRPEIKWRIRPEDLAARAAEQRRILAGVAGAVRPGGLLVYSVCTPEPEEGAEVAHAFLEAHPEFRPAPPEGWPFDAVAPESRGGVPAPRDAVIWDGVGGALLLPHRTGTDGFFIAAFRRAA